MLNSGKLKGESTGTIPKEKKKKRGRPKGTKTVTAIGLAIKKGPRKFSDLSEKAQLWEILRWLGVKDAVKKLIVEREYKLNYEVIKEKLEDIPDSFLSEEVQISRFEDYFEAKCLRFIKIAIKKKTSYSCGI